MPTEVLDEDAHPLLGAIGLSDGLVNGSNGGHSCAVLSDGTVWCWRKVNSGNVHGQLGNGTTDSSGPLFRATQVLKGPNKPLDGVTKLASGYAYATCAITGERALYCWGELSYIVNGGTALNAPYAQVLTKDGGEELTGVLDAAINTLDSCVVLAGDSANELWCWGYNKSGNLGQGDATARTYPVKVPGFDDPTQVVVPVSPYLWNSTVCALDGGKVKCLGYNGNGEAGNDTAGAAIPAPDTVKLESGKDLTGVVGLAMGTDVCALRDNGTIWCWGGGYAPHAVSAGTSNVASLAGDDGDYAQNVPRYLTTDGVYHMGGTTRTIECNTPE